MAAPSISLLLSALFLALFASIIHAQVVEDTTGLKLLTDWPMGAGILSDIEENEGMFFGDDGDGVMSDDNGEMGGERRSLFWRNVHYYISYGALSANRIPCPPKSGRSYYTPNCFSSRSPVNPYTRGCSRITRCRR